MKATTLLLLCGAAAMVGCQSDSTPSPSADSGQTYSSPTYSNPTNSNRTADVNSSGAVNTVSTSDVNTPMDTPVNTPTTKPDNTAINARDRGSNAQTPTAQGEGKSDIEVTAAIRRGILDQKLSVNARNVKIITQNGRVVLRGPVNNSQEKQTIGQVAGQVAGPDNVDNQLEVASSD